MAWGSGHREERGGERTLRGEDIAPPQSSSSPQNPALLGALCAPRGWADAAGQQQDQKCLQPSAPSPRRAMLWARAHTALLLAVAVDTLSPPVPPWVAAAGLSTTFLPQQTVLQLTTSPSCCSRV